LGYHFSNLLIAGWYWARQPEDFETPIFDAWPVEGSLVAM